MIRVLNVIMVGTSILALIGVYGLKYSVEETVAEKAGLQRKIEHQQADLSLLKADWAFLNQPANLAPIVARHQVELRLQGLQQDQFGSFANLPMRLVAPDTGALDSLFESLESGVDPIWKIISESKV